MNKYYSTRVDAYSLAKYTVDCETVAQNIEEGVWVPARPIGYPSWIERFFTSLDVFLGKADALYWKSK